jgi:hypothetical protein
MLTDEGEQGLTGGDIVGVSWRRGAAMAKTLGLLALVFAVGALGGFVGRMLWPEPR